MQALSWYINRFSLMSCGEVAWRAGRALADRIEGLMPVGTSPRVQASDVHLPAWLAPTLASPVNYLHAADKVLAGYVDLFGEWVAVGFPEVDWNRDPSSGIRSPKRYGKTIDYRDTTLVGSARNVWELNRHFQLVTLAQAWALSGTARYREGACDMLASWLHACAYPLGLNWTSALEHGIRLINWYLAGRLLGGGASGDELLPGLLPSIYRHCQFIWKNRSRFSSANNHLIGEMAGLYVASCAWPCWPQSGRWRESAREILQREVRRQVHADGVTREQTVAYQIFVLQFLIVAGLVGEAHGEQFSAEFWAVVKRMISFLRSVANASGCLPDFGDSDDGMVFVLTPDARTRRLQDMLDLDQMFSQPDSVASREESTAHWLRSGFPMPAAWSHRGELQRREFPDGGYFILGHHFGQPDEVSLVFDAAPLGYLSLAAHGHADCLSFVLSIAGEQILIDPGTYCYHDDPETRDYFRSTAAHNTVRVDGLDQSEMAGPFMWRRKAQPALELRSLDGPSQLIRARHDGYERLRDPVTHTREVRFDGRMQSVEVIDTITAVGTHQIERFWHFAERCSIQISEDGYLAIGSGKVRLQMRCDASTTVQLLRGSHAPRGGWVSPRFGILRPTTTVLCRTQIQGPTMLRTSFTWRLPRTARAADSAGYEPYAADDSA